MRATLGATTRHQASRPLQSLSVLTGRYTRTSPCMCCAPAGGCCGRRRARSHQICQERGVWVSNPEALGGGGPPLRPTEPSSPIEVSKQEGDGTVRRVHHLLQHHDVTASQDLQETRKASPAQGQLPREKGGLSGDREVVWP